MSRFKELRIPVFVSILLLVSASAGAATVTIDIANFQFTPDDLTIALGDTVTWRFVNGSHSTTSDASSGPDFWDSRVKTSGTFSHTFTNPGNFPYYCSVHSTPGGTLMNGVIRIPSGSAPTITGFVPTSGGPDTVVEISGTNFGGASLVTFNGAQAQFQVDSNVRIIAVVPELATTGPIKVTTSFGVATSATNYVVQGAAPTILQVLPTFGPPEGGTSVAISGTGFLIGAIVKFGDTQTSSANTNIVDSTAILTVSPAHTPGAVTVSVTNPDGQIAKKANGFTYLAPPPVITDFFPSTGPAGTQITVKGINFVEVTGARVGANATPSQTFKVISATEALVVVPPGAVSGKITIETASGAGTSTRDFTVAPLVRKRGARRS